MVNNTKIAKNNKEKYVEKDSPNGNMAKYNNIIKKSGIIVYFKSL